MKNFSIVWNVVLAVTVFAICFSGCTPQKSGEVSAGGSGNAVHAGAAKIVYINTDTLMNNYLLAVELNEAFLKTQEERRTELNVKAKSLDQEANEFQRKLQNNGFLSEARAVDARDQLLVKQENLRRLQQDMMDKSAREQNELNRKLYDKLTSFLKEYKKEKGFDIVLSTQLGGNVLFAGEGFDITPDVVGRLNEEYKKNGGN